MRSAGQFTNLTWTKFLNGKSQRWNKWKKVDQSVGPSAKHNNREGAIVEPLLLRKAFVDRDQHIEAPIHRIKQGTIVKIGPTHFRSGFNLVPR